MRKKLTMIMLAALIILIGKVDAATLTQKIGDGILQSQVTPGKEVTVKYINTKHEFAGWTVETGNVVIDTTSKTVTFTMPDADVILRANFIEIVEMYTITYDANGGSGAPEPQTVVKGQSVVISSTQPTNTGHTFKGWSTSSDAWTAGYVSGETITPTSNMTLYAVWPPIMSVTLEGGTPETLYIEYGEDLEITATEPTSSNATFIGWRHEGVSYRNGDNIENVKTDIMLPAVYQCTVTYDSSPGTGSFSSQTVEKGDSVTIPSTKPTPPSGQTFVGWYFDGVTYKAGGTIANVSSNMTLKAKYGESTYTITYNLNGGTGTVPSSQTGTLGGSTTISTAYQFTHSNGKSFRGWTEVLPAQHNENTIAQYKPGAYIENVSDMTLYAVWRTPLTSGADFTGADVGAWVTYNPTETSYTVATTVSGASSAQTYNPSSTTTWRVFTNDGTNVEIISDECVDNSKLLKLDKDVGYINLVQTLQDISAAYVNSKFAISARHFGYSEKNLSNDQISNYKTIDTSRYPLNYGVSGFPYLESQCTEEVYYFRTYGSLRTKDKMSWVASRFLRQGTATGFCGEYMARFDGYVYYGALSRTNSDGTVNNSIGGLSYGVRPIIKLGTGLKVASGNGSPSSPYVLAEPTEFTVTYDANGGSNAPEADLITGGETTSISTATPTPPTGKAFRGWSTDPNATVATYKAGGLVKLSNNITLYAVYVTPLLAGSDFTEADIGAYVTYNPSRTLHYAYSYETGYETNWQSFNPSLTTTWRVFDTDGTNVEIVSDESIGDLWLAGSTGYINLVKTLQDLSDAYKHYEYAVSARHLGYSEEGLTADQITNYKTINTTTYPLNHGVSGFPYKDEQYKFDQEHIQENPSLNVTSLVWLASRSSADNGDGTTGFRGDYMGGVDASKTYVFRLCDSDNLTGNSSKHFGYGVRPIVKLITGLTITGGDGSPNNPYTIY